MSTLPCRNCQNWQAHPHDHTTGVCHLRTEKQTLPPIPPKGSTAELWPITTRDDRCAVGRHKLPWWIRLPWIAVLGYGVWWQAFRETRGDVWELLKAWWRKR